MCCVASGYSNSKLKKETISSQNVTEKLQNWNKKFSLILGQFNRALNNPAYIVSFAVLCRIFIIRTVSYKTQENLTFTGISQIVIWPAGVKRSLMVICTFQISLHWRRCCTECGHKTQQNLDLQWSRTFQEHRIQETPGKEVSFQHLISFYFLYAYSNRLWECDDKSS